MQILHSFAGSIQQCLEEIPDADRYRPEGCPQCQAKSSLAAHGFYYRTLVDVEFEGRIRVRRYLCRECKRTVSLLPEFALPYLRFSVAVISLFLVARLLEGRTLRAAAQVAAQPDMPYQRGQFWIRRFRPQAVALAGALAGLTAPPSAADFLTRALQAACYRQHRGAPIPVWPVADAPAGVAAVSGSRWSSGQPAARRSFFLSTNTQHLSGGERHRLAGRAWNNETNKETPVSR